MRAEMNKEKIIIALGVVTLAGLSYRVGVMSANRAQANNVTIKQSAKENLAKERPDRVVQNDPSSNKQNKTKNSNRLKEIDQHQKRADQVAKLYRNQKYAITGLIGRNKAEKKIAARLIAKGYSDFTLKDIGNINHMRKRNKMSINQAIKAYID